MPIVNPFIFYVIDMLDKILCVAFISMALGAFIMFISFLKYDSVGFSEERKEAKNLFKKGFVIFIVSITAFTFIPGKETLYKMLVANYVTVERVDVAADKADEYFNKIVDAIEKRGEQRQ